MIGRLAAGAALGALFLWLALRNVSPGEVAATLREASVPAFALFTLLHLGLLGLRTLRWRLLLRPIADLAPLQVASPLAIGFMVNFLFPGRAGEVVRCWLLGRSEQVSVSSAFATVVLERLLDVLAILCLLAPAPYAITAGDPVLLARVRAAALLLPVAYVAVLAALFQLARHRERLARFLARHPVVQRRPLLGRGVRLLERFCDGLAVLGSWRALAGAVGYSLVIWGVAALSNALMMRAVGLDLPAYAPVFLLVLQGLGVLVPTPGFVGPFQYAHVVALGVYGVGQAVALSLALLIHAGIFVAVLAPGFWFAARAHLGLRELTRAARPDAG